MKIPAYRRLAAMVLAVLLTISLAGCGSGEPKSVAEPASGTILSGYAPKDSSKITVTLEPTASCVVMLKDTSDRTLLSFYVRSGESATVDVPAEKMYVHFAAGKTWYGEELLFGKDTFYSQDTDLTDFTEYSWEYAFDPLSSGNFEYVENEEPSDETKSAATLPAGMETNPNGYLGDLEGQWESLHLQDGNISLNVYALVFSPMVFHCTQMTVNMDITMMAGTHCTDWQVWGRYGGHFEKLGKIDLPAGDGFTSQTLYFNTPVSFDAIAVTPTVIGGYSWSQDMSITGVWVDA